MSGVVPEFLNKAKAAEPTLRVRRVAPKALVEFVADPGAWQGWRAREIVPAHELPARALSAGDSVVVDFGEHLVGHLCLSLSAVERLLDAPVRLKLEFGEVPSELARPFDSYEGTLCRAWLQDEVVNLDHSGAQRLPRRYAFRYVRIAVLATPEPFRLDDLICEACTSADWQAVHPPALSGPEADELAAIWQVGLRTLANCMQTVFEDGPKRDRRLWLGDLRLQALANYSSFRNFDLVRRCLYLFAGLAMDDGLLPGTLYERPEPMCDQIRMLTYAWLFGPTLLDYVEAGGDVDDARELWPAARRQMDFLLEGLTAEGLFESPPGYWNFVDWQKLDKQAPVHAIGAYALRQTATLARRLGEESEARKLMGAYERMAGAARALLYDEREGVVVSGPQREVSVASAAWTVMAGILEPAEARHALLNALGHPHSVKPVTPYLWHYVAEAMLLCRLRGEAVGLLREYWGGMIRRGATTFWEVYDPERPDLSPYNSPQVNSYCHAWSCGPVYLIGRYLQQEGET